MFVVTPALGCVMYLLIRGQMYYCSLRVTFGLVEFDFRYVYQIQTVSSSSTLVTLCLTEMTD
jgi:hypothetical protein